MQEVGFPIRSLSFCSGLGVGSVGGEAPVCCGGFESWRVRKQTEGGEMRITMVQYFGNMKEKFTELG